MKCPMCSEELLVTLKREEQWSFELDGLWDEGVKPISLISKIEELSACEIDPNNIKCYGCDEHFEYSVCGGLVSL